MPFSTHTNPRRPCYLKQLLKVGHHYALWWWCRWPFLLACGAAFAQTITGQIYGKVTDDQGLAVPGATVTVSSPDHIKSEVRVTTDLGTYRVLRLQPSPRYTVQVELGGFATRNFREVNVHAGQVIEVNAILSPSAVQETVTVIGAYSSHRERRIQSKLNSESGEAERSSKR